MSRRAPDPALVAANTAIADLQYRPADEKQIAERLKARIAELEAARAADRARTESRSSASIP